MGSLFSTPVDHSALHEQLVKYENLWNQRGYVSSQTEVFRRIVPTIPADFTSTFHTEKLAGIFTGEKLRHGEGFNCNHLFRYSQGKIPIPVLSTDRFTVLQPLGEPGRDLGDNAPTKVSHLMVITHAKEGPITFNEMLPSTSSELLDLEERLQVLSRAYENLANNVPLSQCGDKVTEKADELGVPHETGIRDFFVKMIYSLPPEEKAGPPGYILRSKANEDVSNSEESVIREVVEETFTGEGLKLYPCIQAPDRNTQILSHIHGFLLSAVPPIVERNYVPIEAIVRCKKEMLRTEEPPQQVDEGAPLARTMTAH